MKLTVVDITRENWAKLLWLFLELGVWLGVSQSLSLPLLSLFPSLSPPFSPLHSDCPGSHFLSLAAQEERGSSIPPQPWGWVTQCWDFLSVS